MALAATPTDDPSISTNSVEFLRHILMTRVPEMFRQHFRAKLERVTGRDWADGALWREFCSENYQLVLSFTKFAALGNLCREVGGKFLPFFESCDPSFFGHVTEDPEIKMAAIDYVHKRDRFLVDGGKWREDFEWIEVNVVNKLFRDFPDLKDFWVMEIRGDTPPPSPLPMHLIPNASFPGAFDSVVAVIDAQIHVFGGDGEKTFLPPQFVWRLDPRVPSWSRDLTTGDVPPAMSCAAGVVVHGRLYLFGGSAGLRQNEIYSYRSPKRLWKKIRCSGLKPSARWLMCSWTDGSSCFFFGGLCNETSEFNVAGGERNALLGRTNQLVRFSTDESEWSDVRTPGPRPSPRCKAGCATVGSKAYVYGGAGERLLNDLWCFDMSVLTWTEIIVASEAKPSPRELMTLSAISGRHLMLIGGIQDAAVLEQWDQKGDVWILDLEDEQWTEENALPPQDGQTEISRHKTALVDGTVFVVGGRRATALARDVIAIKITA